MPLSLLLYPAFAGVTVLTGGLLARFFEHHVADSPVKTEITQYRS